MPRIGILSPGRSELHDPTLNMLNAFLQGLHELGYTEGQNLAVERLYAVRARLATSSSATGSATPTATMGIVLVAAWPGAPLSY